MKQPPTPLEVFEFKAKHVKLSSSSFLFIGCSLFSLAWGYAVCLQVCLISKGQQALQNSDFFATKLFSKKKKMLAPVNSV